MVIRGERADASKPLGVRAGFARNEHRRKSSSIIYPFAGIGNVRPCWLWASIWT